ncbi:hypothetical protein BDB00DRAFT_18720 [Zychaea mexicana]|uniref:uncharacterized protein n=1 Tax=Zychaea mexicana TaxID=64656 RepID=UPI0022FE4472|nr:uncharacterized protein BDB00DRAFT_18720 [Zychaea mexicana]KAI9497186.1 hypothetical protein BDB00DRAFT_18720 [Zychaea mexicana]
MADVSERRGYSKPRKALSFLFPSARAWYGNDQKRSGRIGRNASFGYFSAKSRPAVLDEEEEGTTVAAAGGLIRKDTVSSSESSIDKLSPNRMTFRVMNPDDTLSSSNSTNSSRIDNEEDDDDDDHEVIHYQTHQDEDDHRTAAELGNDTSSPNMSNAALAAKTTADINQDAPVVPSPSSPPPPPPAHALSTPPSTEPSLSSSDPATTTAAPAAAAAVETPTTPVGSHWYAQGWKIAGAGQSNSKKTNRQSKVMEEEVMDDERQLPPAIKTSVVLGAAPCSSSSGNNNNNNNNSGPATPTLSPTTHYHGDRSRSSFDTFRQQSSSEDSPFPSPGSGGVIRSDSTKIEKPGFPPPAPPGATSSSRPYARGTPAYTRPRPMSPSMVLAPFSPPSSPLLSGSGNPASRTPSMATVGYLSQPLLSPQFQHQHPIVASRQHPHMASMTPTHAKGSFIIQNNSNGDNSSTKKQKTYFSKYAKASYSLTNHPDAIKIYRSMAEKTGDPVVQLSYAKYLLEIAELYGGGGGGQGEGIPSSSKFSNQGMRSSTSVVSSASSPRNDVGRPMSLDGYQSAASSRVSLDSVRSAPMAPSPSSSAATATQHRLNDSERRKKKMLEDEGIRWIKRLAKQNVGEAAYLQATWMERGKYGFSKNSTKTFKLYKIAANEGIPEAMHKVAVSYERSGDVRQAFLNYKGAAAQGVVEAIFRMAKVHLHGEFGQRQNMSSALELLSQAAERANEACPEPPYLFGLILTNTYPKADIPMEVIHRYGGELAALRYFEHAAQLGYSHAQSRIAFIYEYGMYGAPMHLAKSFGYYDLAAKQHKHPQAMLGLSRLYNRGCRGPNDMLTEDERLARDVSGWLAATARNEDAAFSWCQKAADRGLDEALFLLGWYYETGVGVPRDSLRAQELYQNAGAKGHKAAAERQYKSVTLQQHERRSIRPRTTTSCIIM